MFSLINVNQLLENAKKANHLTSEEKTRRITKYQKMKKHIEKMNTIVNT